MTPDDATAAKLPTWNLADLYAGPDAPEVERDLQDAAVKAADFHRQYEGNLASLSGAEFLGAIIVLGHATYYPKFGFSADLAKPLRSPFPGEHFMALELVPDMLRGRKGAVRYAKAFGLPVIEESA